MSKKEIYKDGRSKEAYENKRRLTNLWYRNMPPEQRLLYSSKSRAKKLGRDFDLSLEDIVCPEFCPILGIKLEKGEGKQHSASPSLGRIDTSKGYIKGNVHVISYLANQMKGPATREQLISFAEWVLEFYNVR